MRTARAKGVNLKQLAGRICGTETLGALTEEQRWALLAEMAKSEQEAM